MYQKATLSSANLAIRKRGAYSSTCHQIFHPKSKLFCLQISYITRSPQPQSDSYPNKTMDSLCINPTVKITLPTQHKSYPNTTKMSIITASTRPPAAGALSVSNTTIDVPTMKDILETSRAQNLDLKLQKLGPFFKITAKSLETDRELGTAEGVIRVWLDGKILHLDTIRLNRETLSIRKSISGVGLFIGAVAIRHGFDSGCNTAQLLAINDTDLYHSKLVRFYSRLGFKAVHEVDGSSIRDLAHMLVWGGQGTRMDANVEELLVKWCTRFKPKNG